MFDAFAEEVASQDEMKGCLRPKIKQDRLVRAQSTPHELLQKAEVHDRANVVYHCGGESSGAVVSGIFTETSAHALPQRGHRSRGHRGALGRPEAEASSVRPSAPPAGRASRRGRDIRGLPSRSTANQLQSNCKPIAKQSRASFAFRLLFVCFSSFCKTPRLSWVDCAAPRVAG